MLNLGRYEIIEQLGQGSMGTVYKARDPLLDRDVAIKKILVPPGDGPATSEFRDRFFREARAAGRLSHPGIVTVFDVAEHEGTPFLVMEYVAGRPLLSMLQSGERMSLDYARDVGVQLAEALDYAHRNGVVHRDIKPANILVTADNRIKIADFGVAKLIESHHTSKGQLMGTPAFMAPEQFMGMPVDFRSDLFSTGVVIYYMTTGEKPFTGETLVGVQYSVLYTDPVPPGKLNPLIPPSLNSIIMKSIRKDPQERYPSGEELARDLRSCLAGAQPLPISKDYPAADPTVIITTAIDAGVESQRRFSAAQIVLVFLLITAAAFSVYAVKYATRKEAPIIETSTPAMAPPSRPADPAPVSTEPPNKAAALETDTNKTAEPAAMSGKVAQPEVKIAAVIAPQPVNEQQALPEPVTPLPAAEINEAAGDGAAVPQDSAQLYKSARLLIASAAVPEDLTIIINVDNELFFSRNGVDGRGQVPLESAPPLFEERPLAPGKHKVQVNVLQGDRRVAKAREATERFNSGQRRMLQIEFLPEKPSSSGKDTNPFKITLK